MPRAERVNMRTVRSYRLIPFALAILVSLAPVRAEAPPETWLRRVWLDLAGAPPPVDQVDAFLARPDAAARQAVVARLLASPECAARWARQLATHLAPADDEGTGGRALEPFLTAEIAAARPWWRTLGALVTPGGKGSPSNLFQRPFHDDGTLIAGQIGSGMLGIQLRCARCHDDPVHGWTAGEHFGLAAFYGRPRSLHAPSRLVAAFKAGRIRNFYELVMNLPTMRPRGPDHRWVRAEIQRAADLLVSLHRLGVGPSPPSVRGLDWAAFDIYRIHAQRAHAGRAGGFGGTTAVPIPGTVEELRMPKLVALPVEKPTRLRPGQTVPPRFPGEDRTAQVGGKRRDALTRWIADPANPFTARALVNRTWAALTGRGLVEPVGEIAHPTEATNAKTLVDWAHAFVAAGGKVPWLLARFVEAPEYARDTAVPPCLPGNAMPELAALSLPAGAPSTATASPLALAASPLTTVTTAAASAPEAVLPLGVFRFRESESACLRDRGAPDPFARLAARGLRVLDRDQIAAALTAATGAAGIAPALRAEVAAALDLWAVSARGLESDDALVASFPPRMLAASDQLRELIRAAPVWQELAALPDDAARVERLFRRALARPPTAAEKAAALASYRPVELLFRLVTSAAFFTNH